MKLAFLFLCTVGFAINVSASKVYKFSVPEDDNYFDGSDEIIQYDKDAEAPSSEGRKGGCTFSWTNPISDLVLKIIEEIRAHMHDGIPSMGIPPLDPLNISKYDFNVREPSLKVYGNLRDALVRNLSTFNVTNISTKVLLRKVNVSIEIPDLVINGQYTLKGKALSFFPISGHGPFTLKPIDTRCQVMAQVQYSEGHFTLEEFDYVVTIGDLYADFEGIYNSGLASKILNKILNHFGKKLFNEVEPMVHQDLRKLLWEDIDRILKNIKASDVMIALQAMSETLC